MTTLPRSRYHDAGPLHRARAKQFRLDVQALRGVAVLLVVLYHAQVVFPGGFVGVDVFLVISGFVIGQLLLRSLASTDTVGFGQFYLRRIRRLLPPLAVMLVVVLVLSPLLAPISAQMVTSRTGVAAGLISANAYLFRVTGAGYFNVDAALNPLLHTWSLSLEEQFYLFFPALLRLAWKVGQTKKRPLSALRFFTAAMFVTSLVLCVYMSFNGPTWLRFAFFSPVTRAWEFAAGLALVLLHPVASRLVRRVLLGVGAVMIAFASIAFSDATIFPGYAALIPVIGAALVIHSGTSASQEEKAPGSSGVLKPLVTLGDISYSWYLWHWPLIVFAGAFWPTAGRWPLVVAAAVSLVPAWGSYHLVERRMRVTGTPVVGRTVLLAIGCAVLPVLAFGGGRIVSKVVSRQPAVVDLADARRLHIDVDKDCDSPKPRGRRPANSCIWRSGRPGPHVVLLGDSNAGHFSEGLIQATQNVGGELEIVTRSSCPGFGAAIVSRRSNPTWVECHEFLKRTAKNLQQNPPDIIVIVSSTDAYLSNPEYEFGPMYSGSDHGVARSTEDRARLARYELTRFLEQLSRSGARVVVIETVPKPGDRYRPEACSAFAQLVGERCLFPPFRSSELSVWKIANQLERDAATTAGVPTWNMSDAVCPEGMCKPVRDGYLVWRDDDHLSIRASEALAPQFSQKLEELWTSDNRT